MANDLHKGKLIVSAAELGFGKDVFTPLEDAASMKVALAIEKVFGDAANGAMTNWWHCDQPCSLPHTSRRFENGGWQYLTVVAPSPFTAVWFLTENFGGHEPRLFAFASTANVVQAVLGNSHGFEYIVVGQQLDWLFAEDHHDSVSVAGVEAVRRLEAITTENMKSQ